MKTQADPIDEDEQNEIISFVIHDFRKETAQMSKILKIVCDGAAVASMVSMICHTPENDDYKLLIAYYPIYASLFFCMAGKVSQSANDIALTMMIDRESTRRIEVTGIIGFVLTLIQMVSFYVFQISDILIWSLGATNLMVIAVTSMFRFDTKRTLFSIRDLKSSKYKFKSL